MDKLHNAQSQLREMDRLASKETPVHRLHPLAKLIADIAYILTVLSFSKYDLSGLMIMILYPVLMFQAADIPLTTCFKKLRVVLPVVCAVGIANPFMDKMVITSMWGIKVTGGVISMVTLMVKGVLALMASFLLVATTSIDAICAALRKLHVPPMITTLILLTYRYIGVMIEQVSVMTESYKLRAPGQKGIHFSAWGSFLGQLLLRSMDKAEKLYGSMCLRGFEGEFYYANVQSFGTKDVLFVICCCTLFAFAAYFNIPQMLGRMIMR